MMNMSIELTVWHHHIKRHGGRERHWGTHETIHGLRVAVLSELIRSHILQNLQMTINL